MKKNNFLKENLGYLYFFVVSIISGLSARAAYYLDPAGIIAQGDFFELPSYDYISRYNYAVFDNVGQGMANPLVFSNWYYVFLKYFYKIGFIYDHRHFFYISLFLISAYLIFLFNFKILNGFFKKFTHKEYLVSILMAINPLTLTFFRYSWGFNHYILQYVSLCTLIISYIYIITNRRILDKKTIILSSLLNSVLLMFTITNIAFLITVMAIIFIIGLINLLEYKYLKNWFRVNILFWSILFIPIASVSGYMYLIQSEYASSIKNTAVFGGDSMSFVRVFSSTLRDSFFLNLSSYNSKIFILGLLPFILISVYIITKRTVRYYILIPILVLILLSVRIHYPFTTINEFIYSSYPGSFIRSSDKIFFVLVATLFSYIYILIQEFSLRTLKIISIIFLCSTALLAFNYPLKFSEYRDGVDIDLHLTIPKDYYLLKNYLNKNDRIVSLPYNVMMSMNWTDYHSWYQRGHDFTAQLYPAETIFANSADHPYFDNTMTFKECPVDNQDLINKTSKFFADYVLVHKDTSFYFYECRDSLLKIMSSSEYFTEVLNTETFSLYKLNHNYYYSYDKINPSMHLIKTEIATTTFVHPYTYSKYWKIVGSQEISESIYDGYGTSYVVKDASKELVLEYSIQKYLDLIYYFRLAILIILLFTIIYFLSNKPLKYKDK